MDSLITKITRNNTHASQSSGGLDKGNTLNSKKFKITFGCFQISKVLLQIKAEIVEYVFFLEILNFGICFWHLRNTPHPMYTPVSSYQNSTGVSQKNKMKLSITTSQVMSI